MEPTGYFLIAYIILFFLCILSRVLRVRKETGVFPIVRTNTGAYGFTDSVVGVTYILIICNACLFAVGYVPASVFEPVFQNQAVSLSGLLLVGVALLCLYIAQLQMGSAWRIGIDTGYAGGTVTKGLFRYFRHPIYFFALCLCASLFPVIPSVFSAVLFFFLYTMLSVQARLEEEYLLKRFGEEYAAFMRTRRRFF